MPIDFNAQSMFNTKYNKPYQIVHQSFISAQKNQQQDTFTKEINTTNPVNNSYEGILITQKDFGTIQKTGEKTTLYTITNKNGASVDLSTFGATITGIKIPDKDNNLIDITQGYDNVTPYETAPVGHAGGTIGPCANKIADGKFTINGKTYDLEKNKDNGKTHCHGGSEGLDVKNWKATPLPDGIEFSYIKKDMESGYPANVEIKVTYKFDNDNNLRIIYSAQSDDDTLLNLTNHTYFNLDGEQNTQENSVLDHIVTLPNSSKYTQNSKIAIPTGEFIETKGTPFDFSTPKQIKEVINSQDEQLKIGSGFDQNYCIDNYDGKTLIEAADVKSAKTGIGVKVLTNLPGFQFYSANHLGKTAQPAGKSGNKYEKRSAFCIEPQFFPNAINTEQFEEKGILKKGDTYKREIVYSFYTEK